MSGIVETRAVTRYQGAFLSQMPELQSQNSTKYEQPMLAAVRAAAGRAGQRQAGMPHPVAGGAVRAAREMEKVLMACRAPSAWALCRTD